MRKPSAVIAVVLLIAAILACNYGPSSAQLTQSAEKAAGTVLASDVLGATLTAESAAIKTEVVLTVDSFDLTQSAIDTSVAGVVLPSSTPTPTPAIQIAASATDITPEAPAAGQSACDHPWLPLRLGATWKYQHNTDTFTWTVTDVTGDTHSATATVVVAFPASSVTYHFICDSHGLQSYDYEDTVFTAAGAEAPPTVVTSSGAWLLPAAQLTATRDWTNDFDLTYALGGSAGAMARTSSTTANTTGVAAEVVVLAGTFDAIQVNRATSETTSGPNPAATMSNAEALQFAPGVGIVRFDFLSGGAVSSAELVSYTLPAGN